MALRESFESSGQWLFRWRSYLPLLLFLVVGPAMIGFREPRGTESLLWEGFCLCVSLAGLVIRALVVGTTPSGTSGRNTHEGQVASTLNTSGLYSVVRHPLYVGNYLMWIGVALFPRQWWPPVLVSLLFWLYYERIMFAEEEFLRRTFGARFEAWAATTPAFIPRFRRWERANLCFSWRMVLRREYSGFYGLIASFFVLELLGDAFGARRDRVDPAWLALFVGATVVYVTLLLLKRRTRLLRVNGR